MGRKVNDWAWEQELPAGEKFVLLAFAQYASDTTAECHPGIDRLAADCGYGEKAIRRHREALVERGLIEVSRRSRGSRRTSDQTVIVGYLQAVNLTGKSDDGQAVDMTGRPSGQSDPAKRSSCPSQAVKLTGRSNRGTSQKNRSERTTSRAREAARPEVDGDEVTADELSVAEAVIAEFNERNGSDLALTGTTGKATEALRLIVARVREHPELSAEQHRLIVARNFDAPWWDGEAAGVGVIYSPKAWAKARTCNGGRARPKRKSYEREPDERDDPGW